MSTNPERGCSFCTVIANGTQETSERGLVVVVSDTSPVAKGHLLVLPVRHATDLFGMTEPEVRDAYRTCVTCGRGCWRTTRRSSDMSAARRTSPPWTHSSRWRSH
jgi:diadenosine tetraphosphate (Ap4A) HIT family hydrolase